MRPILPWILAIAAAAAGCEMFAYADRDLIPKGGGGAGGSGGAGGVECFHAFDCPGADTPCSARACVHDRCVPVVAAEGTPTGHQIPGDCHQEICDGAGQVKVVVDDSNALDDANPCTVDTCAHGTPVNTPSPAGSPCSAGDGKVCDQAGRCVGCLLPSQCGGMTCFNNHCVPGACSDQMQDGAETGVDCGGPTCAPCAAGGACAVGTDCESGVCSGSPPSCQAPSCADGVQNGAETGVDCGGGCPTACPVGAGCAADTDCAGGKCSGAVCLPTCADGLKDGAETGVDCGGYACKACPDGGGCLYDTDCAHHVCRSGICLPASCVDGTRDHGETDVDCGGGCPPCGPGKGCAVDGDCASHLCAGTICSTPSCSDHVQNGQETGVDCGGPGCGPCADGQGCNVPGDCASGLCAGGLCTTPTCADGIQDQGETGVDCGGPCPGCPGGQACHVNADCGSRDCAGGFCTASTCADGFQNQGESDVDCGGPCAPCTLGRHCDVNADCRDRACLGGVCATPSCTDMAEDGTETDVDCGGTCPPCGLGLGCVVGADCASGGCAGGTCVETLLIGELKSHGVGGTSDEFVELYNPGAATVTVDSTWTVVHRNAITPCEQETSQAKFTGSGQKVPPHGHLLVVGAAYAGAVTADATLTGGLNDAASVVVMHGTAVVDALCYAFDAASQSNLMSCSVPYTCEGTPVSNLPHDNTTGTGADVDASLQRRPGGAAGNGQDTGDSATDFASVMPSDPEDLASPPAP